jgi:hypothetical protein
LFAIAAAGGPLLLDLLDHCVRSLAFDFVFVYLADEYRNHTTLEKALVLYDTFCGPKAEARLSTVGALPPLDLHLQAAVERLRTQAAATSSGIFIPPRVLFDDLRRVVATSRDGNLRQVGRRYRPSKGALGSLPGGRMSPGQQRFVEKVWRPVLRPRLTAAGFRMIATVG